MTFCSHMLLRWIGISELIDVGFTQSSGMYLFQIGRTQSWLNLLTSGVMEPKLGVSHHRISQLRSSFLLNLVSGIPPWFVIYSKYPFFFYLWKPGRLYQHIFGFFLLWTIFIISSFYSLKSTLHHNSQTLRLLWQNNSGNVFKWIPLSHSPNPQRLFGFIQNDQ